MLDYEEAAAYLNIRAKRSVETLESERQDWFKDLDTNMDGYLTSYEIDPVKN